MHLGRWHLCGAQEMEDWKRGVVQVFRAQGESVVGRGGEC